MSTVSYYTAEGLKKLRDEISTKCPEVLSFENLLRDSIINIFIEKKIISAEQFKETVSKPQYMKTDPVQFSYFDDIRQIIQRL